MVERKIIVIRELGEYAIAMMQYKIRRNTMQITTMIMNGKNATGCSFVVTTAILVPFVNG